MEEDDDRPLQALTNFANPSVWRKAVNKTGTSSIKIARMTASFRTNRLLGVRNESICYVVSIDRTKPNNSVRINPATRHPETKYGFVILAGDMIFEYFFVGGARATSVSSIYFPPTFMELVQPSPCRCV